MADGSEFQRLEMCVDRRLLSKYSINIENCSFLHVFAF